ncbi:MAG: HAD family hydrolase [Chthoniobacterales bacterium]
MRNIKLLSTDFDGTLIGENPREACVASLALELEKIEGDGTFWSINTGRPLPYLLEGLEHFKSPIQPHYIITRERYLYYHDIQKGWTPLGDWNERCDLQHQELFEQCGLFFEKIETLVSSYHGSIIILKDDLGVPDGLVSEEEEVIYEITSQLMELPQRPKDFFFQGSGSQKKYFLSFYHRLYNKGTTLEALSSLLSIQADHILAIGDHHNDLSMLHPNIAKMLACPSNAHPMVKEAVLEAGGHISLHPAGKGTAEAIALYRHGKRG